MEKQISELTDQELLSESRKMKSSALMHAFFIGLIIGIIIWAVAKNNLGFFALIPIFIAYKVFHKPKNNDALEKELSRRNLK